MDPQIGNRGREGDPAPVGQGTTRFNGAPDRNPGKATEYRHSERERNARFNGAPDRNPGKAKQPPWVCRRIQCFNGAPDRNPGKESCRSTTDTRSSWSFNGAPDRNPGKDGDPVIISVAYNVSMEPQIGIRGRLRRFTIVELRATRFNGAPDRNLGKEDHP